MKAKSTLVSACMLCSSAVNQAEVAFAAGKQEGRREVVEWITKEMFCPNSITDSTFLYIDKARWQAKLKEWEIEEE